MVASHYVIFCLRSFSSYVGSTSIFWYDLPSYWVWAPGRQLSSVDNLPTWEVLYCPTYRDSAQARLPVCPTWYHKFPRWWSRLASLSISGKRIASAALGKWPLRVAACWFIIGRSLRRDGLYWARI